MVKFLPQNTDPKIAKMNIQNGLTHRSTKRKLRRNQNLKQSTNLDAKTKGNGHNKSLVIGSHQAETEGMASFINELIKKNSSGYNEEVIQKKSKNNLDASSSSFLNGKHTGSGDTGNLVSPKGGQSADSFKPHYLNSKHSIVTNHPEQLINSTQGSLKTGFELKFPNVSSFVNQPRSSKHADVDNKNYIKFEDSNTAHKNKILPSIKPKKSLSKKKRTQNNRDLSMTVIKSGRLALQDDSIQRRELQKNSSMSRESSKKTGRLQFPLNRKEASLLLEDVLWETEHLEILEFEKIYFFNISDRKTKKIKPPQTEFNHGFDNENGDYLYQLGDHFSYRYELIKNLGKGSFGSVIKAFDHLKKEFVALKILRNRKKLHKQGIVEVSLIENLNK